MLNQRISQRGVTLVELMIAIVIMAILMSLALPSYRAWIQNTKIRNTAESILNGLQLARAEAVRRNAPVIFQLGVNSDWNVGCVTPNANCPASIQQHGTDEGAAKFVTVVATPPGGNAIVFNSFGTTVAPTLPLIAFTKVDVDVDVLVLSAAESRNLTITVGAGGLVRMCDPDPHLSLQDPRRC